MSDVSSRSRVQAGVPTGGQFATEPRGENDLSPYSERTTAAIEAMIRDGELSPAARDMDPQEAIEQWGEANAASLWEVQERLDAAGLYLRMRADKVVAGDAVDMTPIIEKYGDPGDRGPGSEYDASLYEMATVEDDPEFTETAVTLHTSQGSWSMPRNTQMRTLLVMGQGRCDDCGEPEAECTCEPGEPVTTAEQAPAVTWHTGLSTGSHWAEDLRTGNRYECNDNGWFRFADRDGRLNRDPRKGPAECGFDQITYAEHGKVGREPSDGPAICKANGQVFYLVDGMPVTPDAETLAKHGVTRGRDGKLVMAGLKEHFSELRKGYALAFVEENPWA